MKRMYRDKRGQTGLTLIEVLIAVAVLGIIVSAVGAFQRNVLVYNSFARDGLSSAQDARSVLKVMVKELRTASQSNTGSYAITTAATSSLTFFSDTDGDGLKEQIRYYLNSTTLMKGTVRPTGSPSVYVQANETFSTLAYNVKNATSTPLFYYYDDTYTGTSSPLTQPVVTTDVRSIKINLMIDSDPNRSPVPRTYTTQVTLRNLKDNL